QEQIVIVIDIDTPVVASVTQPTCDVATGSFSITAVDGLQYSLNGGAYSATTSFEGLSAGTYTVTARNATGCVSEAASVTIVGVQSIAAPVVSATVQPTCDVATGSFSITAVEGLQYSLNGGAYSATTSFEGLSAGTYTVPARNADGCVSEAVSVTINAAQNLAAPVIASTMQPGCDTETGSFTVVSQTGVSYSINGTDYQTAAEFTALTPGNYNVTARNEAGCVSAATVVGINEAGEVEPIDTISDESLCAGDEDLNIAADAPLDLFELLVGEGFDTSGTWEDPAQTGALSGSVLDPSGLAIGNYTFNYVIGGSCPSTTVVVVNINDDCIVLAPCNRED